MSQDELHQIANASTPAEVYVPNTIPALAVWALTKFGVGFVFAIMLVPVYLDLKESNKNMMDITRANIQAMQALANEVRANGARLDKFDYIYQMERNPK